MCVSNWEGGTPGFILPMPFDLPPLDWALPVRLVAVSADGSSQVELSLLQRRPRRRTLRTLLQSDQRGMDGHVDGIQHGDLVGWAGRHGQKQPLTIWLQAAGLEPISIACSQRREGMSQKQMPHHFGFALSLDALPASWSGQSLWCSFDEAGLWRVPQDRFLRARCGWRRCSVLGVSAI